MTDTNTSADTRQPANDLKTLIEYEGRKIVPLSEEHYQIVVNILEKDIASLAVDEFYDYLTEEQRQLAIENLQTVVREEIDNFFKRSEETDATPEQAVEEVKKRRGKHVTPIPLVVKDPVEVLIRSDLFTQQIMRGLLDGKLYKQYPDRLIAEYRQSFAKDKGQIIITISPGSEESWDHVLQSLNAMGDGIRDTFAALLIIAIDSNGAEHITKPFYINPDDILATCQREKAKGSYRPLQRAEVIEHLRTLSRAKVQATIPAPYKKRRGKAVEYCAESALIDILSGKIGAYELITGEELWVKRSIKMGDWVAMVPELNQQTAIMLRQVLKYHSKRQRHEKRLGQYLTFMFRANAKRGGRFQRSMQALLEQSGITPDFNNPGQTRERIESALAQLQSDSVIGKYGLIVDSARDVQIVQERIEHRAYHWWDDYKQQQWYFQPPDTVKEAYQTLLKEGQNS